MAVPISQMWTVATYVLKKRFSGHKRYPLVLMLEPLFRCNLACAGCGKVQYPPHILKKQLTPEECFAAVEECGAPMVSIPGGEPLLHPQIVEIVNGLVARKKYIYLCTNALELKRRLPEFTPSKYLTFSVHLDGAARAPRLLRLPRRRVRHRGRGHQGGGQARLPRHDQCDLLRRHRSQQRARLLRRSDGHGRRGHRAVARLQLREGSGPESFHGPGARAPAVPRHSVEPQADVEVQHVALFLEFLMGDRNYECTPWGSPAYNIFGWQRPCYLLQDGYTETFKELLEDDEVGRVRRGQRQSQVRQLHGELRL